IKTLLARLKTMDDTTPILFLQNGMGHLALLESLHQPLLVGVIEHGVRRISDYEIDHLGRGSVRIARYRRLESQKLDDIIRELGLVNFPVQFVDDWREMLARKLIVNAVINPLTALFNVRNGEVLRNNSIRKLAKRLCLE